ncbi:MAG: CapA family protein [Acidimicrobiia bacterium]|nr:CapA family protein [Acidimicrobiia bacterium]
MMGRLGAFVAAMIVGFAVLIALTSGDEVDEVAELAVAAPTATPIPEPTPTPAPTPTPTPEPPRSVTLAFTGDLLSHGGVIEQARQNGTESLVYDYRPMFALVAPILQEVDLAICHQETPLSADNTNLSGFPIFNAPGDLATAVAEAGWDGCSVASNHALDKGLTGVTETLDMLDRAGLAHSGTARSEVEATTPTIYDVGGVGIGQLSFTYGTNGIPIPADAPWSVNVTTVDAVLAQAAAARAAGADFVVLNIQWGNEYQQAPSADQTELASTFLASPDIDMIVGAHVHVIQPAEVIDGELVLYGLGNFLSNQSPQSCSSCPAGTQDGMIFEVTVDEVSPGVFAATAAHITPTFVDRSTYEVIPVAQALADPATPDSLIAALEASYERTVQAVRALDVSTELVTIEPLAAE